MALNPYNMNTILNIVKKKPGEIKLKKSESWKMFDSISPTYDFLNHLLSLGCDIGWRKKIAQNFADKKKPVILDLATGTADVLLMILQVNPDIEAAYGIDLADRMLDLGRRKIEKRGLQQKITLRHGDCEAIPFERHSFDAITIAFGIRNLESPEKALEEMYRVLKKKGETIILEFSIPKNFIFRALHLFYLRRIVPLIGWLFSGHYQAYHYLNETIESFPYGDKFCKLLHKAGFKNVNAQPLMLGIATIYKAEKE